LLCIFKTNIIFKAGALISTGRRLEPYDQRVVRDYILRTARGYELGKNYGPSKWFAPEQYESVILERLKTNKIE